MGLVEKLLREFSGMDYLAKECIGSARRCLEFNGRMYCTISGPAYGIYCPLQEDTKKEGSSAHALLECRRSDYYRELGSKGNNAAKKDGEGKEGK
jgi:hypothetical protein